MKKTPRILLLMAVAMAAALAWAASPKNANWEEQARQRKADYINLEAANALALNQYDDYYLLAQRAYDLNPSDPDNAYLWGTITLGNDPDSVTLESAYAKMKSRFFSDASNYELGVIMASIAKGLQRYNDLTRIWEMLDSAFPTLTQPAEELAETYLINSILGDTTAYQKALAIYDRLELGQGKNIGLSSQKIRAYNLKKDTAAILAETQGLLDFAPKDSYVALFAGSNYEFLGDLDNALKYYDLACELDSANGSAYMAKAQIYNQKGDSVGFDREVFYALRSQNLEVEPKLRILTDYVAKLYRDRAQEDRIRRVFSELEQMHSGISDIHILYSVYLNEIKDYAGAAEELSYAVALEPADQDLRMRLAQASLLALDTIGAQKHALEGMEKFPDNLYFPIVAAITYRDQANLPMALATLDSVKVDDVKNASAVASFLATKGDFYTLAHDTVGAIAIYEQALALDPENDMALNNCAYFMSETGGDLDKADAYSSKSVRNNPNNPTYLDTYAWIQFKKKEYSLAKQYIDMALRLYEHPQEAAEPDSTASPETPEVEVAEMIDNEDDDAVQEISSEVYEHAGDIYFFNGEHEQALDFWKKALALDPENKTLAMKVKHRTFFFKQ